MNTLTFAILAALAAGAAAAQEIEGQGGDPSLGAGLYERNCAACHGARADGLGPLAPVLILQPRDLTTLAAENGGTFPLARVVARIDGRDPLVAHGSPMPVFGPYFEGDRHVALKLDSGQPVMVSEPVADLVAWLLSIQR